MGETKSGSGYFAELSNVEDGPLEDSLHSLANLVQMDPPESKTAKKKGLARLRKIQKRLELMLAMTSYCVDGVGINDAIVATTEGNEEIGFHTSCRKPGGC